MTTCLALVCDQSRTIFAVADTRFSSDITDSDTAEKIQLLDQRWSVLYAGTVSPCTAAILSLQDQFACHPHTLGQVRAALITACQSWPCQQGEDRYLLVAGFDHQRRPQLLVAYDAYNEKGFAPPDVSLHGRRGIVAIGSGTAAAEQYLAQYRCRRLSPCIEGAYLACAAKFFSESTRGVGPETYILGLRYNDFAQLPVEIVDRFRAVYQQHPYPAPVPTVAIQQIGQDYSYFD